MASDSAFHNAEEGAKLLAGNNKFALDLYRKLVAAKPNENLFFSPNSISVAMAMTYLGARGDTADEMKANLGFADVQDDELHALFGDVLGALKGSEGSYTLHTANRLFGDQSYKFAEEYLAESQKHYGAGLKTVDYQNQFEAARKEINDWVEQQTADKIKDLMPSGSLDALTRMVLVNAIYFKGNWKTQFKPEETKDGEFNTSPGETVPAKFMFQKQKMMTIARHNEKKYQVVEMPYVDDALSMFILLPNEENPSLDDTESQLSPDFFNVSGTCRTGKMDTNITLPRFKLEKDFDLGDTLKDLGVKQLFAQGACNLSGLDPANEVFVSKVVHKSFLEVNEEGSEAAAATGVQMNLRCLPQVMNFKCDRPFLFWIQENKTKSVLFMGRLVKP